MFAAILRITAGVWVTLLLGFSGHLFAASGRLGRHQPCQQSDLGGPGQRLSKKAGTGWTGHQPHRKSHRNPGHVGGRVDVIVTSVTTLVSARLAGRTSR
jgi:hypothetical protein